ncbi:MAG: DNA polymerase III subunit epsilon [Alphaproteobacteria bacterium]|nr:DNA polymerase III subunit epsilon [Alphaproteobacteria bacterium]
MREISLDTETTGLSFATGDRIVEIGCVEIIDKQITGQELHLYVNPERELSKQAAEISGLTYDFLKDYKKFEEISDEFLDFIADSRLVIHNAPFDVGFLNFELQRSGKKLIDSKNVIDTLAMAKEKFPGSPATLDALCRRFSVDASSRTKHGALIDADLLAKVYLHMSVEKLQKNLFGETFGDVASVTEVTDVQVMVLEPRSFSPSNDELNAHLDFLKKLKNPIWSKYANNE